MINLLRSDLLLTGCFSTESWALTQSPYWQQTDWQFAPRVLSAELSPARPGSGYGSRIPQTKKFTGEDRGGGRLISSFISIGPSDSVYFYRRLSLFLIRLWDCDRTQISDHCLDREKNALNWILLLSLGQFIACLPGHRKEIFCK